MKGAAARLLFVASALLCANRDSHCNRAVRPGRGCQAFGLAGAFVRRDSIRRQ